MAIIPIKLNEKINKQTNVGTKEFSCYVEGLTTVNFFFDAYKQTDIYIVYGLKELSEMDKTNLPILFKEVSAGTKTKPLNITGYKYLKIVVNTISPTNNYTFVIYGDPTLLKNNSDAPTTTTTTRAPTTLKPTTTAVPKNSTPPTTTTKAPTTTTKAPTQNDLVQNILKNSTMISLNQKITDVLRSPTNSYICPIEGLEKINVFLNPFAAPNNFIINGIDSYNNITKLFSAVWGGSVKNVSLSVSNFKYIQIISDLPFISNNIFEFIVTVDNNGVTSPTTKAPTTTTGIPMVESTTPLIPEVTKAGIPEITSATIPEITTPMIPEITTSEVPESTVMVPYTTMITTTTKAPTTTTAAPTSNAANGSPYKMPVGTKIKHPITGVYVGIGDIVDPCFIQPVQRLSGKPKVRINNIIMGGQSFPNQGVYYKYSAVISKDDPFNAAFYASLTTKNDYIVFCAKANEIIR